jgi:hypothetical protein
MLQTLGLKKQFKHAQALMDYMLHGTTPFAKELNRRFGTRLRKTYKL